MSATPARLATCSRVSAESLPLWEQRYVALRDKVLAGFDASSTGVADLIQSLEDVLRCARQLVLCAPGPDAIQSREAADNLTLHGVVQHPAS